MTPIAEAPAHTAARVDVLRFDTKSKETRLLDAAGVADALKDPDCFIWADFEGDPAGFLALAARLGVEGGSAADLEREEILPRLIERPNFVSFQLYEVEEPERHLDTSLGLRELDVRRLAVVLGERFVLTYHPGPMAIVTQVRESAGRSFSLWGKTAGFIVFLLMDRCLYDYAHLNLANDNYLDRLEQDVIAAASSKLVAEVSVAGRNILMLKKLGANLQIVLMSLATKRSLFVTEEARHFYADMLHNATSVRAAIDSSRDLLDGVVTSLQAQASQRTSEVARLLTVVSVIFLPLTLISGIYGMNFDNMPELKVEWGYYAVLGVMAGVAFMLMLVFKLSGWLPDSAGDLFKPVTKERP